MKIEWNTVPKWANFVAMDDDGEWYWYERKPKWRYCFWENKNTGRYESAYSVPVDGSTTLEERPK